MNCSFSSYDTLDWIIKLLIWSFINPYKQRFQDTQTWKDHYKTHLYTTTCPTGLEHPFCLLISSTHDAEEKTNVSLPWAPGWISLYDGGVNRHSHSAVKIFIRGLEKSLETKSQFISFWYITMINFRLYVSCILMRSEVVSINKLFLACIGIRNRCRRMCDCHWRRKYLFNVNLSKVESVLVSAGISLHKRTFIHSC